MNKIWTGNRGSAHEIPLSGLSSCDKTIGDTFVYEYTRLCQLLLAKDVHPDDFWRRIIITYIRQDTDKMASCFPKTEWYQKLSPYFFLVIISWLDELYILTSNITGNEDSEKHLVLPTILFSENSSPSNQFLDVFKPTD